MLLKTYARSLLFSAFAFSAFAQQPAPAPAGRGAPPVKLIPPPLFFKEDLQRLTNPTGEAPVSGVNIVNPNLEIKVYGRDAKNLLISGNGDPGVPTNLWNGLSTAPVAATLRDKENFVDLTGIAKMRWVTKASGFHAVRPVVKLADGTFLVGDRAESSTTMFLESEFAFAGIRWVKLDPERVVTLGAYGPVRDAASFVANPDLSKVDEVGFADLMPGSGHGAGGWVNVAHIEVYGKPVKR